jgi:hypothetical protein
MLASTRSSAPNKCQRAHFVCNEKQIQWNAGAIRVRGIAQTAFGNVQKAGSHSAEGAFPSIFRFPLARGHYTRESLAAQREWRHENGQDCQAQGHPNDSKRSPNVFSHGHHFRLLYKLNWLQDTNVVDRHPDT